MGITDKNIVYRLCDVEGKHALFHDWIIVSQLMISGERINPDGRYPNMGSVAGQIQGTMALIEYEDGTVEEVKPEKVRFKTGYLTYHPFYLND